MGAKWTGTDQLINRRQEASVYQTIDGKHICDDIAYINPENGYKITEFLEGARVCDPLNYEDVKKCMKRLHAFHDLKLKVNHEFDIFGQMEFYETLWEGIPSVYKDYEKTKANVLSLKPYINAHAGEKVLTHIDAVPDNFLFAEKDGREEIRLIDWEYAGMQDPHVDVAMFCIYSLCVMPVDIELLARKLGLQVKDKRLNPYLEQVYYSENEVFESSVYAAKAMTPINRRIGQLVVREDVYTDSTEMIIYTDVAVPPSSKRYAIANEIAHFLVFKGEHPQDDEENENKKFESDTFESYFIMPMCPKQMQEVILDVFATFLLIPIEQFFREFSKFADSCRRIQDIPISTEEWIRYLSEKAILSDYYTACGYQSLRSVAYWIYQAHEADDDEIKKIGMTKTERKEIKKNTEYFDEKLKELYQ